MKPDPRIIRIVKRMHYRLMHARRAPHVVSAQCCGLKFNFSSLNVIGEELYANAFERQQRLVLDRVILPGSTVVDVGANLGFYTCLFAQRVGLRGRVIACEPTPATFRALQENLRRNGLDLIAECHNVALADHEGEAPFHVYAEGADVYNSFAARSASSSRTAATCVQTRTTTIDRLLEDEPKDVFIKIDVEGFEYPVLKGGEFMLRSGHVHGLMVELNEGAALQCGSSIRESLGFLADCGFRPYLTHERQPLVPLDPAQIPALERGELPQDVFFFRVPPALLT
jgi:FkbM family methyltransferase